VVSDKDAAVELAGAPQYSSRMKTRAAQALMLEQQRQAEAAAAAQQGRMAELQRQQKAAEAAQQQQVAGLQQQREAQVAEIGRMRLATTAAGASLQALANRGSNKAPTAQTTRNTPRPGVARSAAAVNSLRIGSSARGSGVGVNLGGGR
jgi:colicin import membrane protein